MSERTCYRVLLNVSQHGDFWSASAGMGRMIDDRGGIQPVTMTEDCYSRDRARAVAYALHELAMAIERGGLISSGRLHV